MSIANAVLLQHKEGFRWRTDEQSIHGAVPGSYLGWGRLETFLSVGQVSNLETVDRIGDEYLSSRAWPVEGNTADVDSVVGSVAGHDFKVGDTVLDPYVRDGTRSKVVGIDYTLNEQLGFDRKPQLQTRTHERAERSGLALGQMLRMGGGQFATGTAPPLTLGNDVPVGKLEEITVPPWSFGDSAQGATLEEEWQPWKADRPLRLYEWSVQADSSTAIGLSRWTWYVNGSTPVPFIIDLQFNEDFGSQLIFGPALVRYGDLLSVECLIDGGHSNGSINFSATTPL